MMSVPRPAMLVAIVTAPARPAWAMISASRSTFSGLALSRLWGISCSASRAESTSDFSTDVVPTSTGRPCLWISAVSWATARHLAISFL